MNLNNIVGECISAVNPWVSGVYQKSSGYTTNADGSRTPNYAASVNISAQKQPLTYRDLIQIDGLNLSGEKCALYVTGNLQGISRPNNQGGDLITLSSGEKWLVVMLLENWSETAGWCKVACTLQVG